MGSTDKKISKQISSFCFYVSILTGIIFALLLLIGCKPILYFIGATDNTIHLASIYLRIIAVGSLFIIFSNTMAYEFISGSVAAMGVAMKVGMIVAMHQMGLCMGVLPILAYNFGSNNIKRVKETILKTGTVCMILESVMTICGFIASHFLTTNIMQAAGKSFVPTIVSLSRQGIIYIPCLILSNTLLGLDGLIYTQAVSDILAAIMSIILCIIVLRKSFKQQS